MKILVFLAGVSLSLMMNVDAHTHFLSKESPSSNSRCHDNKVISIHCGKTPSVIFDANKRLWAVFELNEYIYLTYSDDYGKIFSTPVAVNINPEKVYTNGENRPKIAIGIKGEIYISWNQKTAGKYTGNIRFSYSVDQGNTFSKVITVNDDGLLTGHRFDSLTIASDGTIYISWIDKREQFRIKQQQKKLPKENKKQKTNSSAAIYYAYSTNSGKSFSKNKKITSNSCVCCRIAMIATNDGEIALFWRHIFGINTRDHALAIINQQQLSQPAIRATYDNWNIDACPHHGPSLTQDSQNGFHMVWFTASETRKGIFYGQYDFDSSHMKNVYNLSNNASASHPFIIHNGESLHLVWKEFDGEKTHVNYQGSIDNGKTWGALHVLASTNGNSDHPLLTRQDNQTWLSWHTNDEGLRVFKLK